MSIIKDYGSPFPPLNNNKQKKIHNSDLFFTDLRAINLQLQVIKNCEIKTHNSDSFFFQLRVYISEV